MEKSNSYICPRCGCSLLKEDSKLFERTTTESSWVIGTNKIRVYEKTSRQYLCPECARKRKYIDKCVKRFGGILCLLLSIAFPIWFWHSYHTWDWGMMIFLFFAGIMVGALFECGIEHSWIDIDQSNNSERRRKNRQLRVKQK